jgi:hypothetical protein
MVLYFSILLHWGTNLLHGVRLIKGSAHWKAPVITGQKRKCRALSMALEGLKPSVATCIQTNTVCLPFINPKVVLYYSNKLQSLFCPPESCKLKFRSKSIEGKMF